ncbi:hypothetical protein QJU23_03160 [Pasteurella atlantica]|uniref:Uncharacterized protein n=2 Tax=Pasteurellaceae TaxID=712 RepID=A0ACC6HKT9_9PAST|nr:hypothetical protein [Pasteurella atlantica]MDP8051423.1 hypothetical protein [Pasteurella atlantica]MDP8100810.1 hypothetical protein [Pasteurella atlantica]MDP8104697.1 hypothetical protein [Pasteurella atlantica]MDP8148081.1 hypothetical protein [Pasteurella atlantica]
MYQKTLFIIFLLLISCSSKAEKDTSLVEDIISEARELMKDEEDKYPDMPFFKDIINQEYKLTKVENQPIPFDCFNEFYLSQPYYYNHYTFSIYKKDKDTKEVKLFKTIKNVKAYSVSDTGTIVLAVNNGKTANIDEDFIGYEMSYPYDKMKEIQPLNLEDYFEKNVLIQKFKDEFNQKDIKDNEEKFNKLVEEKQRLMVKQHFSGKLQCIREIQHANSYYLFEFNKNKRIVKGLRYTTNDGSRIASFLRSPNNIMFYGSSEKFPFCDDTHRAFRVREIKPEDENAKPKNCAFYKTKPQYQLKLTDRVKLGYYFSGSNHFAIGIGTKELYYYELTFKNKTIKFKSVVPVVALPDSPNYKNLIEYNGDTYHLE